MTIIKPILNFFTHNSTRKAARKEAQIPKRTSEFIEEYYSANKGLVGGPFMSTEDKLKQIQWHSSHTY